LILLLVGFILRQDRAIKSVTSDSGKMQALLFQTNDGLFRRKYCLRITTVKTAVNFVRDQPLMNTMTDAEIQSTKLKWNSDASLTIEFGNGVTQKMFLSGVGPIP
jgi:hypothetical protein